ncbi:MAG TPA: phosphate/phosphite/phosphonate ABC transporter substrate-binding protein [SAR324 cluster bacterium]|jgi:phosphonate transport system substrate-binding protein|nr:phosphonate ABC transporter substrate-binding protein [Pseudomonadota bacterium]MBP45300.1 phosphonate ABC transporter substrate-binding protein [Deltaproteobacteria bacterium]MDP6093050.1 phosphate/phosphite/phosphonate ABC transporter substrate-binding protein [SAR324 cluster bacterium]MDP7126196.1 phosphate/phosphite/phosphonate ABC transporter substrate-binding protein [Candidatus Neomarinimicrobiota bacterium]MDP6246472.1 phosphate/phosphite/phosphonate ABC transporter substrate-binding|tara:strand:+ start:144 stop:1061 length:918 start_codon:yes stop_codon:yes gene_type:complete
MKSLSSTFKFLSITFSLMLMLGSGHVKAAECENPDSLTFAMIPTEESVAELQLYKPVTDRMAKLTGKKIEFFMPTSYASVVEGLLSNFVDVAVLGPYSYVIANSKDPNIEVFATYAKRPGHMQEEGPGYKGVLISKKGTKYTSIDSLKGSILGLTDPGSTSGNLMPRVAFTKVIGKDLEDFFGKVVYTGSHELSSVAVVQGKVDAAFVASHRFDNVVNKGEAALADVNVLWESAPIPQDPFVYRNTLCNDIKSKIRETFLDLKGQPGAKKFLDNVKSNTFVKMSYDDYNIIRDLKKAKDARKKKK